MHRLDHHENEHAPCNAYCTPPIHCDMLYLHEWLVEASGEHLLGVVQRMWKRKGYDQEATIVALDRVSEAWHPSQYYPKSFARRPLNSVPFRVRYEVFP